MGPSISVQMGNGRTDPAEKEQHSPHIQILLAFCSFVLELRSRRRKIGK